MFGCYNDHIHFFSKWSSLVNLDINRHLYTNRMFILHCCLIKQGLPKKNRKNIILPRNVSLCQDSNSHKNECNHQKSHMKCLMEFYCRTMSSCQQCDRIRKRLLYPLLCTLLTEGFYIIVAALVSKCFTDKQDDKSTCCVPPQLRGVKIVLGSFIMCLLQPHFPM